MSKRNIWITVIVISIIIIAIYFYNKNKAPKISAVTDETLNAEWMKRYGLTTTEAPVFTKTVRCIEGGNGFFTDAYINTIINKSFKDPNVGLEPLIPLCGLTASDITVLNGIKFKV